MKKITFSAFLLFVLVFSSCNSVGGNGSGNTTTDVKEGVVVQMNTEMFKKLVYNYQKNPKDWVFEGDKPVIIDFYADWCRPCKMVAPIMDELAKEYKGKVTFYKINTDQEKELSQLFNIRSIPALLYIPKSGQPQMTVGLSSKETYVQQIESILLGAGAQKK